MFYGLHPNFPAVAMVNLGRRDATYNEQEELDEARENVRVAVGGRHWSSNGHGVIRH